MLTKWLTTLFAPAKGPTLSKNAQRRLACTRMIYEGPMRHRDGRSRPVRWLRFDVGLFLDRSRYNGDGSHK